MKNIGKLSDFIAVYIRLLASVDAFLFSIIPPFLTGFGRRLTSDDLLPFIVCSFVISSF